MYTALFTWTGNSEEAFLHHWLFKTHKSQGEMQEKKGEKSQYHQPEEAHPSLPKSSIPLTVRLLKLSTPFWEDGIFPCKNFPSSDPSPA